MLAANTQNTHLFTADHTHRQDCACMHASKHTHTHTYQNLLEESLEDNILYVSCKHKIHICLLQITHTDRTVHACMQANTHTHTLIKTC